MQGRMLELSKKHGLTYGQVLGYWKQAKTEARKNRLKPGSPRHYEWAFKRVVELSEQNSNNKPALEIETHAAEQEAPVAPPHADLVIPTPPIVDPTTFKIGTSKETHDIYPND